MNLATLAGAAAFSPPRIDLNLDSLVPPGPAPAASYYTTWGSEGYVYGAGQNLSLADYVANGTRLSHGFFDYGHTFGDAACNVSAANATCGWAARFHAAARADLFFVLDAGWAEEGKLPDGSRAPCDVLNATKFAPFGGASVPNAQRLRRLNSAVAALGWRGAGLWFGSFADGSPNVTARARASREADIGYWKVDFCADARGNSACALADVAHAAYPTLLIEHGCPQSGFPSFSPFNTGPADRFDVARMAATWTAMLNCSDVFRTYDTAAALSISQTLDRVQVLLQAGVNVGAPGAAPTRPAVTCASANASSASANASASTLVLACPAGLAMRKLLYANFGRHVGSCERPYSGTELVTVAAAACDEHAACAGFELDADHVQFHECANASLKLNHGHDSWTAHLKAARYGAVASTMIDSAACPRPAGGHGYLPNAPGGLLNAARTGGVFASDHACSASGAMAAVAAACVGRARCEIDASDAARFGTAPACARADWRLSAKALCTPAAAAAAAPAPAPAPAAAAPAQAAAAAARPRSLINGDGECYGNVALGVAMGVMRDPMRGLRPYPDFDQQFGWAQNGTGRHVKRRNDEASRAARWQRIGPAFGALAPGGAEFALDGDVTLVDEWHFREGETWDAGSVGQTKRQGAPARMARGAIALPEVQAAAGVVAVPFVVSCAYPTGAASVATLGRVLPYPTGYVLPRVNVTQRLPGSGGGGSLPLVGVFGRYAALRLVFTLPAPAAAAGCSVLAQDLLAAQAQDVTARVGVAANGTELRVLLPGALIDAVGTAARSADDDISDPGMVVTVRCTYE